MASTRSERQKASFKMRPQGRVFLAITILVILAAINTGTNLLYIVVGGLVSFLFISRVLGSWSLRDLHMMRDAPDAVHRGQRFLVTVRLENRKRLVPCMSVRIATEDEPDVSAGYILKIPAQRAAVLRVSEVFQRRGVHVLPSIHTISTFPLGLYESKVTFSDRREVVVYPRVFTARVGMLDHMAGTGEAPRISRGDGDEFFALREYVPGDDVRKINWRATARMNTLIVKDLEPDMSRSAVLILDHRRYPDLDAYEERFEEAVEILASLAVTMIQQQLRVAVVCGEKTVPLGEGSGQILKVLDFLARVVPEDDPKPPNFDAAEGHRAAVACVSPNPQYWGRTITEFGAPVVHPKEVARA